MSRSRRIGVVFGVVAFVGLAAVALLSPYSGRYFSGLPGIEDDLGDKVEDRLVALGVKSAIVTADGRDLSVTVPGGLAEGLTEDGLARQLSALDGVRKVSLDVKLPPAGSGGATGSGDDVDPDPTATPVPAAPTAAPQPDPTAIPGPVPTATAEPVPTATAEPAPQPTATPAPTATAAPSPTATPLPDPDPVPTPEPERSVAEIVSDIDLTEVSFVGATAELTDQAKAALDKAAEELSGLQDVEIEVQAHTAADADPDANLLLSQDRAEAVVAYLVAQDVDAAILTARGYGAAVPIADNRTEQGRAANSRVELSLVEGN